MAIGRADYRNFNALGAEFVIHSGLQVYAVARFIVVVNDFERIENSVFKQEFEHRSLHVIFAVRVPVRVAQNAYAAEFSYFIRNPIAESKLLFVYVVGQIILLFEFCGL